MFTVFHTTLKMRFERRKLRNSYELRVIFELSFIRVLWANVRLVFTIISSHKANHFGHYSLLTTKN